LGCLGPQRPQSGRVSHRWQCGVKRYVEVSERKALGTCRSKAVTGTAAVSRATSAPRASSAKDSYCTTTTSSARTATAQSNHPAAQPKPKPPSPGKHDVIFNHRRNSYRITACCDVTLNNLAEFSYFIMDAHIVQGFR